MSGIYGFFTLTLIFVLGGIITPSADNQLRGWRRARKQEAASLPLLADAATGFWAVLVMSIVGAGGWYGFTRALVESRWFPGHELSWSVFALFSAVLLAIGMGAQVLLEAKGGRVVGIVAIFMGVIPIMVGAVLSMIGDRLIPLGAWLIGISPLSSPFYAAGTLLPLSELPVEVARAVPRAFYFWLLIFCLSALWLVAHLWAGRRAMAREVLGKPPALDKP